MATSTSDVLTDSPASRALAQRLVDWLATTGRVATPVLVTLHTRTPQQWLGAEYVGREPHDQTLYLLAPAGLPKTPDPDPYFIRDDEPEERWYLGCWGPSKYLGSGRSLRVVPDLERTDEYSPFGFTFMLMRWPRGLVPKGQPWETRPRDPIGPMSLFTDKGRLRTGYQLTVEAFR